MQAGAQSPSSSPRVLVPPREILRLAVPAFLTLIAEPLFLLADNAIVGYLGTAPLAGLGVASAVLLTLVGVFVFLAYGSTAVVARRAGAGDTRGAIGAGLDGMYLAVLLGVASALGLVLLARPVVGLFDTSPEVAGQAVIYLTISAYGIPSMLVVLAATGVLRGLQDTRTPLVVASVGFPVNAALSLWWVHGMGLGIAGAAWGTVVAQSGMALALVAVVLRGARHAATPRGFHPAGVLNAAVGGVPLILRTLSLRATLLATTWVAAAQGDVELAAFQVSLTVWNTAVFALDALAIAAQAITGKYLGASDVPRTRQALSTLVRWAMWFGLALGLVLAALHAVIPLGFSTDPQVRVAIAAALLVVAASQPISGVAFVLDGVLMGAGDMWWLALAQAGLLLAYLPLLYAVWASGVSGTAGLVWLWVAFSAFMVLRAVVFVLRSRSDRWMVTGAKR